MLLKDKVILVTGAARGIGRGITQALAEDGASVVVTDVDRQNLFEALGFLKAQGVVALGTVLDVTDEKSIQAALDETMHTFKRIDGLVNNAGVIKMAPALNTTLKDWDWQFAVNVSALFRCCQLVAKQMVAQGNGGAIVNVASNCGKVGYNNMVAYNASKAAVISITRSLSNEWADQLINVNAVCPGGVDTPMLLDVAKFYAAREGGDPHEMVEHMVPHQLKRHIQPIEVGRIVAFLLSERATIMRGQSISIDGGDTPY